MEISSSKIEEENGEMMLQVVWKIDEQLFQTSYDLNDIILGAALDLAEDPQTIKIQERLLKKGVPLENLEVVMAAVLQNLKKNESMLNEMLAYFKENEMELNGWRNVSFDGKQTLIQLHKENKSLNVNTNLDKRVQPGKKTDWFEVWVTILALIGGALLVRACK